MWKVRIHKIRLLWPDSILRVEPSTAGDGVNLDFDPEDSGNVWKCRIEEGCSWHFEDDLGGPEEVS
jgi:hypothetical protein